MTGPATRSALGDDECSTVAVWAAALRPIAGPRTHPQPAPRRRCQRITYAFEGHACGRRMKRVPRPRKPGGRAKRACVRNSKVPQWAHALEIGSESESELLEIPASSPELYCVCRTPYNDAQRYIGCDSCHGWFHFDCVAATSRDALREKYFCPACADFLGPPQVQAIHARTHARALAYMHTCARASMHLLACV